MATFKLEIVTGGPTYTNTKTISAAHLTRWVAALRVKLNMTNPSFTDAQVADAWFNTIFALAITDTRSVETQVAADSASAGVTPIVLT